MKAQPFPGASEPRIPDGLAGPLAHQGQVLHVGSHSCFRGGRTEAQDVIPLSFCLEAVILGIYSSCFGGRVAPFLCG